MIDDELLGRLADAAGLDPAAIVLADLDTPEAAPVRAGSATDFYPASMIKVPLVAAALAEIDAGRLSTSEPIEVTAANMTSNDAASPLVPGYRTTASELMHRAISRSDNVATNMLFDLVGRERADEIARERFGLTSTRFARKLSGSDPLITDPEWNGVDRNAHSPDDATRLLAAIARGSIPGATVLTAMLAAQMWNEKLSPGLRDGDRFFHKTGETSEVTHDGGILITDRGRWYTLVVYTGLAAEDEHNQRFGTFMRELREYL
jgi:beta-lactamase class A